jgi:hypothetical protein
MTCWRNDVLLGAGRDFFSNRPAPNAERYRRTVTRRSWYGFEWSRALPLGQKSTNLPTL